MRQREFHTATANVYSIRNNRVRKNKACITYAYVTFMDYNGQERHGLFVHDYLPIRSTLREGMQVEIEYRDNRCLPGEYIRLKNPEQYQRVPSKEESAMYKHRNKMLIVSGIQSVLVMFASLVLCGLVGNLLPMLPVVFLFFWMMKKHEKCEEGNVYLNWNSKPEDQAVHKGKPVPRGYPKMQGKSEEYAGEI